VLWLALALMIGGVITGLLAGTFGVGGGSVIVPVLYEGFRIIGVPEEVRMQLCLGTSIAIIVPTTIQSYRAHRAKGYVIPGVIKQWALPAVLGVACSAAIVAFAPAALLMLAFVLIVTLMAMKFLFARDRWNLGTELPGTVPMSLYGFGIGLTASLLGVSGGALSTMVLTLHGRSIHSAIATASGIGVPIAAAGTIAFVLAGLPHLAQLPTASIGFVSPIGLLIMAPVSSLVAPYGALIAHRLPKRALEIGFGCFLQLVAIRFLVSLL
jgi:uncharacterized membrane protein YfcA